MKGVCFIVVILTFIVSAALGFAIGGAIDIAVVLFVAAVPIVIAGIVVAINEYWKTDRPMGGLR